jgi:hypothetical protein
VHIFILDGTGGVGATNYKYGYRIGYEADSNRLNISKCNNTSWSYNYATTTIGRVNTIYIHFQRTAGVNYGFGSMDGMAWWQLGTGDSMVFDAKWAMASLLGGGSVRAHAGIDWMRFNHLNLLV